MTYNLRKELSRGDGTQMLPVSHGLRDDPWLDDVCEGFSNTLAD